MSNAAHWNTAAIESNDARGLAARHIAYLRKTPEDALEPLITRQRHDVIGHLVEQRDPRLADALKPNLATVYGLAGAGRRNPPALGRTRQPLAHRVRRAVAPRCHR
nr:hypothetical protein [uncultured Pseudomonas sp.]